MDKKVNFVPVCFNFCAIENCVLFFEVKKRRKKGEFVSLSSSDSSIIIRIFRWTNDQRFGLESLTKKCIIIKKLNFLKFFFFFEFYVVFIYVYFDFLRQLRLQPLDAISWRKNMAICIHLLSRHACTKMPNQA